MASDEKNLSSDDVHPIHPSGKRLQFAMENDGPFRSMIYLLKMEEFSLMFHNLEMIYLLKMLMFRSKL